MIKHKSLFLISFLLLFAILGLGFNAPFAQTQTEKTQPLVLPKVESKKVTVEPKAIESKPLSLPQTEVGRGILKFNDFSGGLNLKAFPTELKDNEAQVLNNAIWDKFGALRRRDGFVRWKSRVVNDSSIFAIYRAYDFNNVKQLYFVTQPRSGGSGGHIYLTTTSDDSIKNAWISLDGTVTNFGFIAKNNEVGFISSNFWYNQSHWLKIGTSNSRLMGVADTFVVYSYSCPSGCSTTTSTTWYYSKTASWSTNQWAGYAVSQNPKLSQQKNFNYVTRNTFDTIFVSGYGYTAPTDSVMAICSFFREIPWYSGKIDSAKNLVESAYLYDDSSALPNCVNSNAMIRITSGRNKGLVRAVNNKYSGYIRVTPPIDSVSLLTGASYEIKRLLFYDVNTGVIHKNRLWLAGDSIAPNMVYYSELANFDNFAPLNFIYFPSVGGDKITGLASFYNDQAGYRSVTSDILLVLFENHLMGINADLSVINIATGVGCISPRSLINAEGHFIGFASRDGYYIFDGNKTVLISEKIKPFWDGINKTRRNQIACGYNDRHIWCSVPYGSSVNNDTALIYNIDNGSWATANIKANCFGNLWGISDTSKFVWGRNDSSYINIYGLSNLDNGTDSITLSYKSKEITLDDLTTRKRFREFYITYNKDSSLYVDFYKNFGSTATASYTITGTGYDVKNIPLSADIWGKTLSWGLRTKDPSITIGGVQIKFSLLGGL